MDKSKRSKGDMDETEKMDKTKVLEDAKECFRARSEKTSKIVDVLTKCIYLMLNGETLTISEATDLFFLITRLFQYRSKDDTLRRLTYIAIKAISHHTNSVFAVTASLTTDVNNSRDDPAVRASALRALCQITDVSLFTTIEPYLKQSIVDQTAVVASAALTSLIHISQINSDIVERYTNDIQEALKSHSPMVQYHALALYYMSSKNDLLAISRLLKMCVDQKLTAPLAICLLLRILASYINNSPSDNNIKLYTRYISDCLVDRNEMVAFEAAKTIVVITKDPATLAKHKIDNHLRNSAMAHLRNLLTCSKPILRFSSLRLLNDYGAASLDTRCWSIQRIGNLCKLHLLTKRYKPGDDIIGMLEFIKSSLVCAKYVCTLQCESNQMFEVRQEFSLGYKQCDFVITIPEWVGLEHSTTQEEAEDATLHGVLSFIFYITDRNYPRALFEDKAGTIELGPNEIETKQFSCDFPILINTCITGANV